MITGTSYITRA